MTDTGPNVLIAEERIAPRVTELAAQISADYAQVDELVVIGVLKGAFIFLADLARQLTVPHRVDFIAVSSYADGHQRSGEVRMVLDLRESIEKRHVLVVEDIVDTGRTLRYLVQQFEARDPASVRTCALTPQEGAERGRGPDRLSRLRHPGHVGGRLRARLRGASPHPALHRGARPGDAGRGLTRAGPARAGPAPGTDPEPRPWRT